MDKIRIGVIGLGRGQSFMGKTNDILGIELVALCDTRKELLEEMAAKRGVAAYTDYDEFLKHDMDAVVLANYFNEHAPFAIKALRAGKHVMSETTCNSTLAEGVELCRELEKSGKIYMLAENYPYTAFNLEMKRLYEAGEIGGVTYADGEYNHPIDPPTRFTYAPRLDHWRNLLPSTYYCTHALAPLMHITGTMPVSVSAFSIANAGNNAGMPRTADNASIIICRMDNGAIFKLFGPMIPGHSNWYRIFGQRGAMETVRGPGYFGPEKVRIWHEEWDLRPGEEAERVYKPGWAEYGELAEAAGHGGGDFWVNFHFAKAIRENTQPFLNVYRGVAMSSVGIFGWLSALEGGRPYQMPDFSDEEQRKAYENDSRSPFAGTAPENLLPGSILPQQAVPEDVKRKAEEIWKGLK